MKPALYAAAGALGAVVALAVVGSRPRRGRHRKPVLPAPVVRPEQREKAQWN